MRATSRLRELLAGQGPVLLPGVYDALSARIAASSGFEAIYISGSSVSAGLLGRPDVGLTTLTEMVDVGRRVVMSSGLPVVADADTGFGNALNVLHTVKSYEAVGLAGLHMEDQISPKKCGHFAGHALVSIGEMVGKLHAAVDARSDPDFLLIARTDARGVSGLTEAIDRAHAYLEAGADAIFVEAPRSRDEYASIARAMPGELLVADVTEGGKSPQLEADEYHSLGFKIVIFSASASRAVMKTLESLYRGIREQRTTNGMLDFIIPFDERNRLLALEKVYEQEKKYGDRTIAGRAE